MSIKLLDKVSSVSVSKSSKSVKVARGVLHHIVDCLLNSTTTTEISACVVKLQGSETNEDGVNGVVTEAALAIGSTPEQVANGAFDYRISDVHYTKGAVAAGTAISGFTVAVSKFGGFVVQVDSSGTITTQAPVAAMSYDTIADANTAVDALTADPETIIIGKVLIENDASLWTAGTDDLTNASDVTTASFISIGSSFDDMVTKTFSADELANARAKFSVAYMGTSWVRAYLTTLTGTGEVTLRYTPIGG